MRKLAAFAVLIVAATQARADGLDARALFGFEQYANNQSTTTGYRQTYDLRLDKALTGTSRMAVFFRANDFRGNADTAYRQRQKTGTRELRPGGEIAINMPTVIAMLRSETFDTRTTTGVATSRRLQRSTASATWTPESLPVFHGVADRSTTSDASSNIHLVEDFVAGSATYNWRGLAGSAEQRVLRSTDDRAGYRRNSNSGNYRLGYATTNFNGKFSAAAEATAELTHRDEVGVSGVASVPTPVTFARALWSVDDTPLDSRDHPPLPNPALIDGFVNVSTGISLGPDAVSFQNLTIDFGRIDRLDEVRIIVRDSSGAPMRNGGGPVTWDAYTSEDGNIWTPVASTTTFNAAFSAYSITFPLMSVRWFKVVNFGVNSEATFVTELQAYYHTQVEAGQHIKGLQKVYTALSAISFHPVERLTVSYSGLYSSLMQNLSSQPENSTKDLENVGTIEYHVLKTLAVRTQLVKRDVNDTLGRADNANNFTGYLDWTPTSRLTVSIEDGRQDETIDGDQSLITTYALHATGYLLRSVQLAFDAGTQTQDLSADSSTAERKFVNFSANVQWTRTLRMLVAATMQRTNTQSTSELVQLLGPTKDNRVTADFIWRPGRQLLLSTRFGWVSGLAVSTFTQRYHAEWFPFDGGTVSLAGSYDEDIDAATNRRARRAVFNPHWQMNRWVVFDLNYTTVNTSADLVSNRQRTLFFTVSLIK